MRILIAVDFGLYGQAQTEFMRSFGDSMDLNLKVLHVVEPLHWELQGAYPATMALSEAVIAERRRAADQLVLEIGQKLQDACPKAIVETEIREGNIAAEILAAANQCEADLLIVGSHGKSGIERFLLGSVSQSVSAHANCSVLIARLRTKHN